MAKPNLKHTLYMSGDTIEQYAELIELLEKHVIPKDRGFYKSDGNLNHSKIFSYMLQETVSSLKKREELAQNGAKSRKKTQG